MGKRNDELYQLTSLLTWVHRFRDETRKIARQDCFYPNDRRDNWRDAMGHLRVTLYDFDESDASKMTCQGLVDLVAALAAAKGE